MKNKKAAFEMSITTIVILVIALSMLIFGLLFVRNMMCSGMNIMTDVTSGTQKEIDNLFNTKGGEVVCLGEGAEVQDVYPTGDILKIYCAFNVETSTPFNFELNINQLNTLPGSNLRKEEIIPWVGSALPGGSQTGTITAKQGETMPIPIMYMNIPKNAATGSFSIPVKINGNNRPMVFNVKRVGAVKSAIC
jgi:hypothetical protein